MNVVKNLYNVNNYLNTNIYSYLETSGGQSSNRYLNVVRFTTPLLIDALCSEQMWKGEGLKIINKMKTRSNELNFAPSSPAGDMITETPTAGGEGDSQHQLTESGSGPFAPPPQNDILQKIVNPAGLPDLCQKDFESWTYKVISLLQRYGLDPLLTNEVIFPGWEYAEKIAKDIIVQAIPSELIPTISGLNTVYKIWTKLQTYLNGSRVVRLVTKLQELMQMKFQGGDMERYVKLYEAKVQSLNLGWNTDELCVQLLLINSIIDNEWDATKSTLIQRMSQSNFEQLCQELIGESLRRGKQPVQTENQVTAMISKRKDPKLRIITRGKKQLLVEFGYKKGKCVNIFLIFQ